MNSIFKRIVCLMLVAMFCLTALIGCNDEQPNDDAQTTDGNKEVADSTEGENTRDILGDSDFDGAEYKVLARESTIYEFNPENEKGLETVNNAVYIRNASVTDRFDVKLRIEKVAGDWAVGANNSPAGSQFYTKYSTIVQSGWSDYALVTAHMVMLSTVTVSGFCHDLTTLDTINMTKEWWSKPFYEACNIEGKFYVAVGDIAYNMYEYMEVVFFNETMAGSYVKDATGEPIDLYELVGDGEWTWEKMKEYTLAVSYNEADPEYGMLMNGHALKTLMQGMDLTVSKLNKDTGKWEFPEVASENVITRFDEVAEFMTTNQTVNFDVQSATDAARLDPIFSAGDALFYPQTLDSVVYIGEHMASGQEYGILPYPKYDEDQLEYRTTMRDSVTAVTVPKNIKEPEMVGTVTEALCMYGYQDVRPVYLDTVVKGRYLTNANMKEMLDIIRLGVTASFDMTYGAALGYPYSMICDLVKNTTRTFSSRYASQRSGWVEKTKQVYESLGVSS